MKDQHEKIKGYRDLTQKEIDLMNRCKSLAEDCGAAIVQVSAHDGIDQRCTALAKTNLQQGFMWLIRSIARPETFG